MLDTIWHFTHIHVLSMYQGYLRKKCHRVHTEWKRPLSDVHSRLVRVGGALCTSVITESVWIFSVKTCELRDRNICRQVTKQNTHVIMFEEGKED
jgi:hypothetical protein